MPPGVVSRWLHDDTRCLTLKTCVQGSDQRLSTLVKLLWAEAAAAKPNGMLYVEGLCQALLALLLSDHYSGAAGQRRGEGRFNASQRARVLDLIEVELTHDLSIERMASLVGLSPFHFSRLFKATFSQSPHAFVLEKRIDHACIAMRRNPEATTAQVALDSGFSSHAHFTAVFRKKTGLTPSRWRKGA